MNQYIVSDGILRINDSTFCLENQKGKEFFPIEQIDSIFLQGNITVTKEVFLFCLKYQISLFYCYNEQPLVSVSNSRENVRGETILKEAKCYSSSKRLRIAKAFLYYGFLNMATNVKNLPLEEKKNLLAYPKAIQRTRSVNELMLVEAKGRKEYYSFFDNYFIKNKDFEFKERMMHPALNEINAMISYMNAVFYGVCRSLIFQVGLEPSIGFLHSTAKRKSSLEYDISEVYKPLLVDRTIFRIVNLGMVNKSMFAFTKDGEVKINENGKRIILFEFESRLNSHITYKNKTFSYRELILNDLYHLKNYILGESRNLKFYQSRF